ncbi:hypothetical protein C7T35_08480 [Variovorax sp. WS11]|uniref:gamma-butyrobetaine hydroxylase-like domain-containing protein n=1 Tax=Variovorax sp. WS11 TaxID=1105204 RepID=UPI000D0D5500|nr:gamma-butyrobetaine hydroxylase-like domain-containing protein [Variovorax sp. WS11]NDZ17996.1 DUF971 domain-containing protein [Variovorax sp. WS11]PSL84920.1 hypothetical protein C7T35_08480 [Variovorax sp. WS11]
MSGLAPLAIELRAEGLQVQWCEGSVHLPAVALRAACRCGACRARAARERGSDEAVQLTGAAPVGEYGLQLLFSDGHDRGIYPWSLLQELSLDRPVASCGT